MEKKSHIYQANSQGAEVGIAAYKQINEEFSRGCEINKELLMKILRDNQDTEYGKKYGFADITTVEEYQKRVPVIVYDNISAEIERMCNGEQNILTAYPYQHMNETSATTGSPKRIPMTQAQSEVFLRYNKLYMDGLKAEALGSEWMEGRAFCTTEGKHRTLPSGITVGDASSVMANYIRGGKETMGNMMAALFTSPVEATLPVPQTDTKYIHTRFALMDADITGIICGFYSLVVNYLKYIAENYELLIDDIEHGTISDKINLTDEVRESLLKKIEPMPERASELRKIFENGSDFCFVPKVWPKMIYISGVGGDGFSIYDRIIKERYTGSCLKNIVQQSHRPKQSYSNYLIVSVSLKRKIHRIPFSIKRARAICSPAWCSVMTASRSSTTPPPTTLRSGRTFSSAPPIAPTRIRAAVIISVPRYWRRKSATGY